MPDCRRAYIPGGTYFFTVVTERRARILCGSLARSLLRRAFRDCRLRWPFVIQAIVLLPDHLHAIWTLPPDDSDYSARWGFIKKEFSKGWLAAGGSERPRSDSRFRNRRRGIWQRRFWEHVIRNEDDFIAYVEHIHYNPVRHGLVQCPHDWPYSSFHRYVRLNLYPADWGCACGVETRPRMAFPRIAGRTGE